MAAERLFDRAPARPDVRQPRLENRTGVMVRESLDGQSRKTPQLMGAPSRDPNSKS